MRSCIAANLNFRSSRGARGGKILLESDLLRKAQNTAGQPACGVFQIGKKPRRVCARRRKESEIIFSGGVYGGENTARPANVRAWRVRCSGPQPLPTRAQRSGSRWSVCQKHFLTHAKTPRANRPAVFSCLWVIFHRRASAARRGRSCAGSRCWPSCSGLWTR